jgi:hypothetical protein
MSQDSSEFMGVVRTENQFAAYIKTNDKQQCIGIYGTPIAAALARDMELLRRYGEEAPGLNFGYEVEDGEDGSLIVYDSCRNKIVIDANRDPNSGFPEVPVEIKQHQFREVVTAPLVQTDSESLLHTTGIPWVERIQSAYSYSTTFTYEVSFPHQNPLGLNLKPHSVMYSQAGGNQAVGCLCIMDVTPFLASVISPGDFLLRINDTELATPGHLFDFEKATRSITSAQAPRVLRFMRPAGPGVSASPSEIYLSMREHEPLAKFQVTLTGSGSSQSLQLAHIDPQVQWNASVPRIITLII